MPRQRKPKTAQETALPVIYDALAKGATVAEACALAKCGERSFYEWQAADPQVKQAIDRAREAFAATADAEVTAAAAHRILDLLRHGHTVTKTRTEYVYDDAGERRPVAETVETIRYTTPQWVFDKLMPESLEGALPGALHQHVHYHQEA